MKAGGGGVSRSGFVLVASSAVVLVVMSVGPGSWSFFGSARPARSSVGPEALAFHEEVVGRVEQTVQKKFAHHRVGEQLIPVGRLLTGEIVDYLQGEPADISGAELARRVQARFGVDLHRRTVERVRRR
jgi:hypothetical protein